NCKGCHNPQTHDFNAGEEYSVSQIVEMIKSNPLLSGITISGGEPFCQPIACSELAREVHSLGLSVWCYTGFDFEEVSNSQLMRNIDVLVDGKFDESLKSADLQFRGSSNQRIINVPASLSIGKIITMS
ncbi:MAG: 4Fe-4S cluster-binding domain-containing protein, partial [Spirochaetia bacterium]|nr:4Fe-4S cluster-binding domain-containing protein [Spirochaetia bacterium]